MAQQVMTPYGFGIQINTPYERAIEKTKAALKEQGFGVLTEIDVRKTLKEKLDVDFRPYVILGACNPPLAHQAFQKELNIGLVLPCNVIVYREGEGSVVAAMDPEAAMGITGNSDLESLAKEAKSRLAKAIDRVAAEDVSSAA